jgi:hypothetical protein
MRLLGRIVLPPTIHCAVGKKSLLASFAQASIELDNLSQYLRRAGRFSVVICQRSSNNPQVWSVNSPHPLTEGGGKWDLTRRENRRSCAPGRPIWGGAHGGSGTLGGDPTVVSRGVGVYCGNRSAIGRGPQDGAAQSAVGDVAALSPGGEALFLYGKRFQLGSGSNSVISAARTAVFSPRSFW